MTKKKIIEKLIIILSLITVLVLLTFFLKDIMIPFIKLELKNDLEGAKQLLLERSVLGFLAVTIVEALQMVVIFIPAEFIQISSGLSYPVWLAVVLCDVGVCLGATIIFILVRSFKFNNDAYEKNLEKIERLAHRSKKEKSTMLLMYFLFFMPLIPFGAICYYGSSTKIRYWKYILTVSTGVIPSILTSILMGTAAKAFISNAMPIWLLILIIIGCGALLFLIIFIFLDKIYFKENNGTPDSVISTTFMRIYNLFNKKKQTYTIDEELSNIISNHKEPYFILANHTTYNDFYHTSKINRNVNYSIVANEYYLNYPIIHHLAKKTGFISKKLFNRDVSTSLKISRMIKKGYPIFICPEGRLSLDGTNYPIMEKSGAFYKKLGTDVIIIRIYGGYFSHPKWRKRHFKSDIHISLKRLITKEEIMNMSADELNDIIDEAMQYDENLEHQNVYHQLNKALGLENVLYRCVDCGALYSTKTKNNDLICSHCGKIHHLNEHYQFDDEIKTIHNYYEKIKSLELNTLNEIKLETNVRTKIFKKESHSTKKEKGKCILTKDKFIYESKKHSFEIELSKLLALPFSCNEEFELYHEDQLYYFYPTDNKRQVVRWALIVDLVKELENGKKENFTECI